VRRIVVSPSQPDRVLVALDDSAGGGVYVSDHGGAWTSSSNGLTDKKVSAFAADPHTPGTWWVGTESTTLFKSTDDGGHWSQVPFTPPGSGPIAHLEVSPADGTVLVSFSSLGIWASSDGGAHWAPRNGGLHAMRANNLLVDPNDPATLYLGTEQAGLYKSTNGGDSWLAIDVGLPNLDGYTAGLVADPSTTPSTLYAAQYNLGVVKSPDGGAHWSVLAGSPVDVDALAIDPVNPQVLWIGQQASAAVLRTSDGGAHWTSFDTGGAAGIVWLACDPKNPDDLFAISGNRLFFTNGATQTTPSFVELGASAFMNVGGLAWLGLDPGTPGRIYAVADANSVGQVFRSDNSGVDWTLLPTMCALAGSGAIDPNDQSLWLSCYGGIFKLTNAGMTATVFAADAPTNWAGVTIDAVHHGTVYAVNAGKGVFKTTTGGM
jgi:photosystem II stability/assembly factor-like uncharacterized protein